MADEEFVVTPYEVRGKVDHQKLMERFGAQPLGPELLDRIRSAAGGELHPLLARGIYYCQRDLAILLDRYQKGEPFFLYTGRGPSGPLHTSHLVPFELCQWIQAKFHVPIYIQITDDEKFWFRANLTRAETRKWGMENLADILAVGFDPDLTHIFFDTRSIAALYPLAVEVAKRIPYSTVKAVFGLKPSQNVGLAFYTALQTVPCFYPSWAEGKNIPCLIPCGIDQDPHFRVTRDMAESLGYPKPSLVLSQMLPGLLGDRVMSTTGDVRDNALFLNDPSKEVERKIRKAFTGGRTSIEEQKRLGATPEICSVWAAWRSRFARDEAEFGKITDECRSGKLMCGDCKAHLIQRVEEFQAVHAERRAKVEDLAESLIIERPPPGAGTAGAV